MSANLPPWHMWGNSQTIGPIVGLGVGTGPAQSSGQLVRIDYARPETWRWTWEVTVLSGSISVASANLVVLLQATTGVGRSQTTIPIGRFNFTLGVGPVIRTQKYTNNVSGPNPDDTVAAPGLPNVINTFVGQDIQVNVVSQFFATAGDNVSYETTALFAPETHVRPEWFHGMFSGGEDKGR